jgi:hypothetical protein
MTICRNGQSVWVWPRERAEALFAQATAAKKLPPPNKKFRLEPFRLPVPEKQLVFLPILFQVTDLGEETLDAQACRILGLRLMPELARSLDAAEWSAHLWIRSGYVPMKIALFRGEWKAVIRIDDVHFASALPEKTWEPGEEQREDAWTISAAQYQQLLKLIGGK